MFFWYEKIWIYNIFLNYILINDHSFDSTYIKKIICESCLFYPLNELAESFYLSRVSFIYTDNFLLDSSLVTMAQVSWQGISMWKRLCHLFLFWWISAEDIQIYSNWENIANHQASVYMIFSCLTTCPVLLLCTCTLRNWLAASLSVSLFKLDRSFLSVNVRRLFILLTICKICNYLLLLLATGVLYWSSLFALVNLNALNFLHL